uniref:Uncharacterized protein n=1 Tax=viral metagenome TaxID=1070528 RepID=A0A6M3Y0R0_9ZZZZ
MKTATLPEATTKTPTMTPIVDAPPTEASEDKDVDLGSAVQAINAPVHSVPTSLVRAERTRVQRNTLRWAMLQAGASAQQLRSPGTKDIG